MEVKASRAEARRPREVVAGRAWCRGILYVVKIEELGYGAGIGMRGRGRESEVGRVGQMAGIKPVRDRVSDKLCVIWEHTQTARRHGD
jgi:hypothetical protein